MISSVSSDPSCSAEDPSSCSGELDGESKNIPPSTLPLTDLYYADWGTNGPEAAVQKRQQLRAHILVGREQGCR